MMVEAKSGYTSLLLLLKMDKDLETGQGIFNRLKNDPSVLEHVNVPRYRAGTVFPSALASFMTNTGVHQSTLDTLVSLGIHRLSLA
jgi:hypothetical protein